MRIKLLEKNKIPFILMLRRLGLKYWTICLATRLSLSWVETPRVQLDYRVLSHLPTHFTLCNECFHFTLKAMSFF